MKNEKKRVYDQKRSVVKILFTLVGFLWFDLAHTFAQETAMKIVYIDSLPSNGVVLNKGWKFHAGDSGNWANPTYDDSHWKDINPTKELNYLPQIRKEPVGWFRLKLHIDSSLLNKPLAFTVFQSIASEIYLDGTLLKRYGVVSHKGEEVDAIQPINLPVGIQFNESDQVFAVRFSVENDLPYLQNVIPYSAFRMSLNDVESAAAKYNMGGNRKLSVLNGMYTGVYLVLTIIHLGLFVMYRKQKANLFFSIVTASGAIANSLFISIIYSNDISFRVYASLVDWLFLLTFFNLTCFSRVSFWEAKSCCFSSSCSIVLADRCLISCNCFSNSLLVKAKSRERKRERPSGTLIMPAVYMASVREK